MVQLLPIMRIIKRIVIFITLIANIIFILIFFHFIIIIIIKIQMNYFYFYSEIHLTFKKKIKNFILLT